MKSLQLVERIFGFIIGVLSIFNLIYCFIDAPSGISRIDLITICMVRQSIIFIPLVILGLIDFIFWIIKDYKKEKRTPKNEND